MQIQLAAVGQRHGQHVSVQEQALTAQITDFLGEILVAILAVTGNAMASMQRVHANLVGTTGNRLSFDHGGKITETAQHLEHRQGFFAFIVDFDHALAGTQIALEQRCANLLDRGCPVATDQCHVTLVDAIAAQLLVQVTQHAALLGDHQQSGGVTVETVNQLQLLGIGTQLTKGFDHAEVQPAAAMNRNAGGLIDHDQGFVFEDDRGFQALQQPLGQRHRLVTLRHANRRHAHDIAGLQLVFGLDPTFVHTHFAFAQNAVNQGLGHAFEPGEKKVVDSLAGILRRDFKQLNAWSRRGSSCHAADDNNFYGIEALNHCCYSRERRQKRPGQRNHGQRPALTNAIHQGARPSYGAFAT